MNLEKLPNEIRVRLLLLGILAAGALILFGAYQISEKVGGRPVRSASRSDPTLQRIDAVVDTLLRQYHIDKEWVKVWRVRIPNRSFHRIERRVLVPRDFISVSFNHDLNLAVAELGARAVASERTRESTVTMHIVKDGLIVESISFIMQPTIATDG